MTTDALLVSDPHIRSTRFKPMGQRIRLKGQQLLNEGRRVDEETGQLSLWIGGSEFPTFQNCGKQHAEGGWVKVDQGVVAPDQVNACRSSWACGFCSPRMWRGEGAKMRWFVNAHHETGGSFIHTVLTFQSRAGQSFAGQLGLLGDTWSGEFQRLKPFREAAAAAGVQTGSYIRVTDITWNPVENKPHSHFHVLWFADNPAPDVEAFNAGVGAAWGARLRRSSASLGREYRQTRRGVHVYSELVMDRFGVVRYMEPDDPDHPLNDCAHQEHPGCPLCEEPDDPLEQAAREADNDDDGGSVVFESGGGRWVHPVEGGVPRGIPVLAGVGRHAVLGNKTAQGVFREYLLGTKKKHRVVFPQGLRARYPLSIPVRARGLAADVGERVGSVLVSGRVWCLAHSLGEWDWLTALKMDAPSEGFDGVQVAADLLSMAAAQDGSRSAVVAGRRSDGVRSLELLTASV